MNIYTGGYTAPKGGEEEFNQIQQQLRDNKGDPGSSSNIKHIDNVFKKMEPLSVDIIVNRGLDTSIVPDLNNVNLQKVLDKLNKDIQYKLHLTPEEYAYYKSKSYDHWQSLEAETEKIFKETGKDFRYTLENHQKCKQNFKEFKILFKGQTSKDYGYMSTSLIPKNVHRFGDSFFIELHVPKGAKAIAVTPDLANGTEFEMILPRGTEYIIKNVEMSIHETKKVKITAEVKLPTDVKTEKFTFAGDACSLGGGHEKYFMKGQNGDLWLFKVSDNDWVGEAEVGANKLLKKLGQPSVEIGNVTLPIPGRGNVSGSIQKIIPLKTRKLGEIEVSELSKEQLQALQIAQIIDSLLANLDCHGNNFGIDEQDHIVALDKGLALKHFGDTSEVINGTSNPDAVLSLVDYNLYEEDLYYTKMWKGFIEDKIVIEFTKEALIEVIKIIEIIEGLSDIAFSDMFRSYAEGREKQTGESAEQFLAALVNRKNTIRPKVEAFYKEIARKKGISFAGFSTLATEISVDELVSF